MKNGLKSSTEIKIGDYILATDKSLYRIIDIVGDPGSLTYDIKALNPSEVDGLWDVYGHHHAIFYRNIKGLSRNALRRIGQIIPEEEATAAIKILYG